MTEARLYGPASYPRAIGPGQVIAEAAVASAVLAEHAEAHRAFPVAPAAALVRIADARILDRAVYQMRDGVARPLYETQRFGDRPYLQWTEAAGEAQELPDNQDYLLLSSAGSFNWGHWIVDDLGRLKGILEVAAAARRRVCVLVHAWYASIDTVRLDSLKALIDPALSVSFKTIFPTRTYLARTLFFVTPVTVHPMLKHPEAMADLAAAAREAGRWPKTRSAVPRRRALRPRMAARRLFVVRRPGRGRAPADLDALCRIAEARGFAIVDPDGADAEEQIATFAGAEIVAGCMGAAMTNTAFCPPGARILHLAPDTFREPFYWDLAAARGHAYAVCYGRTLDPDRPGESLYDIAPEVFAEALDRLG